MKDERLLEIEREKERQLAQVNQQMDDLLIERNELTNQQNEMVDKYEQTQNENLDKQLAFQKDLINQQKQEAQKNYENEARSAYTDYRRESNDYGLSREQLASQGLTNSGYSESSRVGMYNAYQNRLGMARKSMDKAYLDFNNAIREAQLTNDVNKAENALKTLQNKLQISLEGFGYKDALTRDKINTQNQISDRYYNRYQNQLNQINYEKEQEENRRRYEDELAYRREQNRQAQRNWEKEYALKSRPKYYNSSGSTNNVNLVVPQEDKYEVNTPYYQGKFNKDVKSGTFSNNYQPDNINGKKLKSTGDTITFNTTTLGGQKQKVTQNIWTDGENKYYWDGRKNSYQKIKGIESHKKKKK